MPTRARILEPLARMLCSALVKLLKMHVKASPQLSRYVIDSFVKLEWVIQFCTPYDAMPS